MTFHCNEHLNLRNNLRASVQLPKTLFNGSITQNDDQGTTIGLQFIFYKGPQLFPITTSQHDDPHLNSENLKHVQCLI
ncbi:hypothetical protein KUTeg_005514 [Tegillarca granosa]|uniref:Uncharacterized protein n=1 Tax=Tegillarca granosa TaxID=220873 RepID=A0ABQ9FPG3_TEGGR|nr:hypothetical protein KUTeg_005514 [Tegillarca granosa]